MSNRKWLGLAVKLVLTVALFWLILHNCDWSSIGQRLGAIPAHALLLVFALISLQTVVLTLRWCWITECMGFRLSLRDGLMGQLISQFFNQGLPSSLGGDGVRIWWLRRVHMPLPMALENVLLDRLAGFLSLLGLTQLSLCLLAQRVDSPAAVWSLVLVSAAGVAGVLVLLLPWRLSLIRSWEQSPGLLRRCVGKGLDSIADFRRLLLTVGRSPRAGSRIAGSSLAVHMVSVYLAYYIAVQVGMDVGWWGCLAAVVPALLVAYLPVSIAGWGVREGAMVVAFGLLGVPQADALMVSVTLGLGYLVVAMGGGLLWLAGGFYGVIIKPSAATPAEPAGLPAQRRAG
jgi:uncharacterized protein (TIRG00374 family)